MTTKIIDHDHPEYRRLWSMAKTNRFNGAYYYSQEIVRNIIPRVSTDRNWITINVPGAGCDHAIVFIHNNLKQDKYNWLKRYKDLVLVCGIPETCEKVRHLGRAIYLPLSIDVEAVKEYRRKPSERHGSAFAGRSPKRSGITLPAGIHYIEDMPRPMLLKTMANYETIYAVGRTAIEAKALGCKVGAYDPRFPDPKRWRVIDNKKAAEMLQKKMDKIDGEQTK